MQNSSPFKLVLTREKIPFRSTRAEKKNDEHLKHRTRYSEFMVEPENNLSGV
jgi:hypothetical protein